LTGGYYTQNRSGFSCSLRSHEAGECGSFFGKAEKSTTSPPFRASEASRKCHYYILSGLKIKKQKKHEQRYSHEKNTF
jgi:hypothetical protein